MNMRPGTSRSAGPANRDRPTAGNGARRGRAPILATQSPGRKLLLHLLEVVCPPRLIHEDVLAFHLWSAGQDLRPLWRNEIKGFLIERAVRHGNRNGGLGFRGEGVREEL